MTLPIGYFTFDDQMRQALAMVIVMYALRYADRDNFMKYLLLTLLAAAMHYSALVVLPFYFVRKMKVELGISLIVIGLFFVLFITGITQTMMKKVYEIIPFYSHYANNNHYLTVEKISTGLGALLMLVMYTFSIVYKNKINRPVLTNFLFFGILILLFSAGNLNIARIAKYFLFVSIYTLGTVFTKSIKLDMKLAIILVMLIFFQKNLIEKVHYPAVYKSIFSNDAKIEYFEPKSKK
jgi:transmembrane protein EpsG